MLLMSSCLINHEKFELEFCVLNCIWSFLSGRNTSVSVGGLSSSASHVSSGVPQGSVLGPVLVCSLSKIHLQMTI